MMSRTFRLGNGEDDAGKTEKALGAVGVAVRDTEGDFRNFNDILADLHNRWGDLTNVQKTNIAQQIGGTHHYSKVISLLNNYSIATEATESALNSQGSAMAENEKALNSVSGKWRTFLANVNNIKLTLFDNETLKNILNIGIALSGLLAKFGGFKTVIASILLLTAKKTGIFNWINLIDTSSIKQIGKDLKDVVLMGIDGAKKMKNSFLGVTPAIQTNTNAVNATNAATKATTLSAKLLKVAFTTGVIFLISFAIEKMITLISKIANAKNELKEFNAEAAENFKRDESTSSNSKAIFEDIKNAQKAIENTSDEGEKIKLNKELVDLQRQMAELLPATASGYDENGNAIATNNDLIKQQLDLLDQTIEVNDKAFLDKNKFNEKTIEDLDTLKEKYDLMNEAQKNGKNNYDTVIQIKDVDPVTGEQTLRNEKVNHRFNMDDMKEVQEQIQSTTTALNTFVGRVEDLNKKGFTDSEIEDLGYSLELYRKIKDSIAEANKEKEKLASQKLSNEDIANNAIEKAKEDMNPATAGQTLAAASEEAQRLRDIITELNEANAVTPSIMSEISDSYPEFMDRIYDATTLQEALNEKIKDQAQIQKEAYAIMIADDEAWYNSRLQNGNEMQNAFNQFASNFMDINAESYTFDASNYATLNEAKAGMMRQLAIPISQFLSQYVGGTAESYQADLNNFNSLAEAKVYVLGQLNEKMKVLQANYEQILSAANEEIAWINSSDSKLGDMSKKHYTIQWNRAVDISLGNIAEVQGAIDKASAYFEGLDSQLVVDVPSFSTPNISSGSGSGGGSGADDASKAAEKAAEDAAEAEREAQEERIRMEEEANNRIEKLRDKLISALKKKYEELREKELEPLEKEIEMKQKELDKLRNGGKDEKERLAALKEELRLWEQNDSSYAKEKIDELKKQVKEAELELEIKDLEDKREAVNNKYDALLEEEKIYAEASKMIQQNKYEDMKNILQQYGEDFKDIAVLLGTNIADIIKGQLDLLKNSYDFLKGKTNTLLNYESKYNGTSSSSSKSSSSSSSSSGSNSGSTISKGSRVKVTNTGAGIYYDSYTGSNSGTWSGAGVSSTEGLYVVNTSNGRVALSRSNSISGAIGWIDMSNIARFKTGGDVGNWNGNDGKLAVVDTGERVLTKEQNALFGKLVYEVLPQISQFSPLNELSKIAQNIKNTVSNLSVNNSYSIVNNTPFDVYKFESKLEDMIVKALNKAGIKVKY